MLKNQIKRNVLTKVRIKQKIRKIKALRLNPLLMSKRFQKVDAHSWEVHRRRETQTFTR